jgi:hypothetical protein
MQKKWIIFIGVAILLAIPCGFFLYIKYNIVHVYSCDAAGNEDQVQFLTNDKPVCVFFWSMTEESFNTLRRVFSLQKQFEMRGGKFVFLFQTEHMMAFRSACAMFIRSKISAPKFNYFDKTGAFAKKYSISAPSIVVFKPSIGCMKIVYKSNITSLTGEKMTDILSVFD